MFTEEIKKRRFIPVKAFINHLIRLWNTRKLLRDIKQSEKEFSAGKFKVLKSLKDLR